MDFLGAELAFGHRQTQSCFSDALENLTQVGLQLLGVVGGNPDVIDVLSAFVSFDDSIEILSHEAREGGEGPAEPLCKSQVRECSTGEIES